MASNTRTPARRRALWLLAMALVAVQTLGFLHRVAHARHGAVAASVSSAAFEARTPAATGWLDALFSGHAGGRDCDAFDQTSHADLAVGGTLAFASAPPEAPLAIVHRACHIAAQARGFLARAPPPPI